MALQMNDWDSHYRRLSRLFLIFSSRGRVWKTGEKTVIQCVDCCRNLICVAEGQKDADFVPHVLMEKEKHEWSDCELLSEALINEYHVPKNAALAVTMLAWCKYLLRTDLDAVVIWAEQVWNVIQPGYFTEYGSTGRNCPLSDFISQCGLSVTLREYGLRNFDSRRVALRIAQTDVVEVPTESDIQAIYELAKG